MSIHPRKPHPSRHLATICPPPPGPREDLRHLPVCSVDPPGCKDIDDALHCSLLPNGNYEVGRVTRSS